MKTKLSLLLFIVSSGCGCATVELYEVTADQTDFATIQENDPPALDLFDRQYVRIHSIDRKLVSRAVGGQPIPEIRPLDAAYAILLVPGEHQILAHACIYKIKAMINSSWQCAETILWLDAMPGVNYLLKGDIHRKQDYADFWIEDLANRRRIVDTVRISGFPESH